MDGGSTFCNDIFDYTRIYRRFYMGDGATFERSGSVRSPVLVHNYYTEIDNRRIQLRFVWGGN